MNCCFNTSNTTGRTALYNQLLFKILLVVPIFCGLSGWIAPLAGAADPLYYTPLIKRPATPPFSLRLLHQGMVSQLNISLDYELQENVRDLSADALSREVVRLLTNYPEKYDYWEVVNLAITESLLETYPRLAYVTLQLEIIPSDRTHYHRTSTVTRWSHGDVSESWRFEVQGLPFHGRNLGAAINYRYTDAAVYPDYLDICHQLIASLDNLSAKNMPLEQLERTLAQHLLQHYSDAIADISIQFD